MNNIKGKGYLFKRNGIYYVRIKINKKPITISLKTTDKTVAEKKRRQFTQSVIPDDTIATLNHIKAQIETENERCKKTEKIEIKNMLIKYLGSPFHAKLSDGTIVNHYAMVNHFVRWFKKSAYMCDVTDVDAVRFVTEMKGKLVEDRLFATVCCLRRIWDACKKYDNNIGKNVWEDVGLKCPRRSDAHKRRELSDEEVERLLSASRSEYFEKYWNGEVAVLFEIGAFTALRVSDCCSLRWSEIGDDLIRKLPKKTEKEGKQAIIPICNRLRATLEAWKNSGRSSDEFVLPILHSRSRSKISKITREVFSVAGIAVSEREGGKIKVKTGFHGLRVYALSRFLRVCGNINVVQTIAAHKRPDMTMWYTHCREEDVRKAFMSQSCTLSADTVRLISTIKRDTETPEECIRRLATPVREALPINGLIVQKSA